MSSGKTTSITLGSVGSWDVEVASNKSSIIFFNSWAFEAIVGYNSLQYCDLLGQLSDLGFLLLDDLLAIAVEFQINWVTINSQFWLTFRACFQGLQAIIMVQVAAGTHVNVILLRIQISGTVLHFSRLAQEHYRAWKWHLGNVLVLRNAFRGGGGLGPNDRTLHCKRHL